MKAVPLLAIAGPTAAGKTQLALDVAAACFDSSSPWDGAEIVSVDSAQIYRGMDIGTAKPDAATQGRFPHHLIDILDPAETYSAARFASEASLVIKNIRSRNRIPILVGGTMLYFRALLEGLSELPAADPAVRVALEADARTHGWGFLHDRLAVLDPESAQRLHPNDAQRIGRALEILSLTGKTLAQAYAARSSLGVEGPLVRIIVCPESRAALHQRIEQRFHTMLAVGLLDEVRTLHSRGDLHDTLPSIRAVGYRQLWEYLDGQGSLDDAVQRAIAATRRYAKRQLTWLRSEQGWIWQGTGDADFVMRQLQQA